MINLGLARIARLLAHTPLPWKAIHVAGTNGKGSVCAYASAMLRAGNVHSGRFTSPHLMDRWDCITVDEKVVEEGHFRTVEEEIKHRNIADNVQASEFELLTATAFTIFTREQVDFAVVEVGLGGREDATNIIQDPVATVITNISKDHQSFLGNTVEQIAAHKAGIIKPNAPCFVDGSNTPDVLDVIRYEASRTQPGEVVIIPQDKEEHERQLWNTLPVQDFEPHQRIHVSLAFAAVERALRATREPQKILELVPAVRKAVWPGRLQTVSIEGLTGRQEHVLLDGAHNASSAQVLRSYVDREIRRQGRPVTWVIGISKGKDLVELTSHLIRPQDRVVATRFGPVDGMPWVGSADTSDMLSAVRQSGVMEQDLFNSNSVLEALLKAVEQSKGDPMVIAGSLYLVSDVLRLLRDTIAEDST
jgi:folylpolyglutamate synthase/dihydrofolate synthase